MWVKKSLRPKVDSVLGAPKVAFAPVSESFVNRSYVTGKKKVVSSLSYSHVTSP